MHACALLQVCHIWRCTDILLLWHPPIGLRSTNIDISLQSGWFWATSIASFRERLLDFRSCWIVFIYVVRGYPSGLLQFSKWKLDLTYICFVWHSPNVAEQGETLCLDNGWKVWLHVCHSHLVVSYMVYHSMPNRFHKHHWSGWSKMSAYHEF